ncbi:MAG: HisA/HisF-related TIM barrel protein [Isosphaeraceae bacterium]
MAGAGFRVVPVLDVLHGRAVHAVAGERSHYRPIRSRLHPTSEPLGLARAYRNQLGLHDLYVADLDAILGGEPDRSLYQELGSLDLDLWLDAGIRDAADAARLEGLPRVTLVVGLETIRGPEEVQQILERIGPDRVVLSLDQREGSPLVAPGTRWSGREPLALGLDLMALGVRRFLLLDLARVGTGRGIGTEGLLRDLREAAPGKIQPEVSVGGGIATIGEVAALRTAGAAAVLIGSALHDERVTRVDLDALMTD